MNAKAGARGKSRKPFPTHLFVFLVPPLAIYALFMIIPLFDSLRLSLYATMPDGSESFAGLDNFARLFTHESYAPRLWGALKNNCIFFLINTLVQNTIGLLLAVLLSKQRLHLRRFYLTVLFLPTMLSYVIVGFSWKLILSPVWGVSGTILKLFGLGHLLKPWLGMEGPALVAVSLISCWQWIGIPMMLFYAALLAIPNEFIEAATVDGVNTWQAFWKIKMPLLLPTVGMVEILTYVGNFNTFDIVYVMQNAVGAPNYSTDLLGTFFYRTFSGYGNLPGDPTMGTAIGSVIFLIILAGVLLYLFGWKRRVRTYEF
jgi:raffinose/stachyose/melibiose transport system permease protein